MNWKWDGWNTNWAGFPCEMEVFEWWYPDGQGGFTLLDVRPHELIDDVYENYVRSIK